MKIQDTRRNLRTILYLYTDFLSILLYLCWYNWESLLLNIDQWQKKRNIFVGHVYFKLWYQRSIKEYPHIVHTCLCLRISRVSPNFRIDKDEVPREHESSPTPVCPETGCVFEWARQSLVPPCPCITSSRIHWRIVRNHCSVGLGKLLGGLKAGYPHNGSVERERSESSSSKNHNPGIGRGTDLRLSVRLVTFSSFLTSSTDVVPESLSWRVIKDQKERTKSVLVHPTNDLFKGSTMVKDTHTNIRVSFNVLSCLRKLRE